VTLAIEPAADYAVDLPAFHGPLDLLLHLIRSQEMNIHDIPIVRLVEQYQAFLTTLEETNLTVAGEYLYMLSVLLSIKARMLLPRPTMEESEDPREPLVRQILAYEAVKRAADELSMRHALYGGMTARETGEKVLSLEDVSLYDLSHAFVQVLARLEMERPENFIPSPRPSLRTIMVRVIDLLPGNGKPITLKRLLAAWSSRMEVITSFIAILELARLGVMGIVQGESAGEFYLRKKRRAVNLDILEEAYA